MPSLIRIPKVQVVGILFLFFLLALPHIGFSLAVYLLLLCVGSCVLFDIIFAYIRRRKFFLPYAGMVTGLIITLIIDPSAIWYQILIICAAAIGIKNFLRIGGRHILNPAASGLMVGWVLFRLNPSWWGPTTFSGSEGVGLNIALYCLLALIALISCVRYKKYYAVITYLLGYILLSFFMNGLSASSLLKIIESPGTLFYALLMLPEPMTSPVKRERQAMYGGLIALISVMFVFAASKYGIGDLPDYSITALLIGNILFFKFR